MSALLDLAGRLDAAGLFAEADLLSPYLSGFSKSAQQHDLPTIATVALFRPSEGGFEALIETRAKNVAEARQHALAGGHLQESDNGVDEHYAEAASRELHEETGLEVPPEDLLFVCSKIRTRGKEKNDVLFTTVIPAEGSEPHAADDAADARWLPLDQIPSMAFDHNWFIELALKKLYEADDQSEQTLLPWRTNSGLLICFEGPDGAGKSSQMAELAAKLEKAGYSVRTTKWGSSGGLRKAIKDYKQDRDLQSKLYSLLYAADLTDRYHSEILPWLADGKIVLCDRYVYTSYVRDSMRGVDTGLLDVAYKGFLKPDLTFYLDIAPEIALERLRDDRGIGHYGAGLDLHLSVDPDENFLKYQRACAEKYNQLLVDGKNCVKISTNRKPKAVGKEIWGEIEELLGKGRQRLKRD